MRPAAQAAQGNERRGAGKRERAGQSGAGSKSAARGLRSAEGGNGYVRHRRLCGKRGVLSKAVYRPAAAGIPRVRFRRRRLPRRRGALRAQTAGRGQKYRRRAHCRQCGHRAHPLGHARRPVRRQRPPAPVRQVRPRAQRHHRKRRGAARRTGKGGRALCFADGQRGQRAAGKFAGVRKPVRAAGRVAGVPTPIRAAGKFAAGKGRQI